MRAVPIALLCAAAFVACTSRALDGVGSGGSFDLAAPVDGGPPPDLARRPDLAQKPDLSQPGTSCAEIFTCLEGCVDDACAFDCYEAGTPDARQAFDDFTGCAEAECGPVCLDPDGDCDACFERIQTPPGGCNDPQCGACFDELTTCFPI